MSNIKGFALRFGNPVIWCVDRESNIGKIPIVGMRYRPEKERNITALIKQGTFLWLVREPNNPHDAGAYAVYAFAGKGIDPYHIGYVAKETSSRLKQDYAYLTTNHILVVRVSSVGTTSIWTDLHGIVPKRADARFLLEDNSDDPRVVIPFPSERYKDPIAKR